MTGPKPPAKKRPPTDDEAEMMVEAYGRKGAAMRRAASGVGKAQVKADSDSTSLKSKVKRFLKKTSGG